MTSSDSDEHESAQDDATSRPPEGTPPAIGTPDPEHLAAFTDRTFLCHHCGADGAEGRDTDSVVGPVRYRLGAGALLLPYCPACDLDRPQQRRAAAVLARAVQAGTLAWVDPGPLTVYRCSRPDCARLWHHLGGPLPYPVVDDPHLSMPHRRWHPCPWCTGEAPGATTADHDRCRRTVDDLARWEREFRRQEPW